MVVFELSDSAELIASSAEHFVKRHRLSKPKTVRALPATKSLSDRYAEVLRLRRAICQTQAALQAPTTVNRLAAK
ncbi:hypothetical protein CQ12_04105 [Bradyrhizobium jicamae]|uniref:Uncharacterized protein n=1 Tax=Bradyrhizobium jicamae TaxID=280332 RepID=A0A0R3KG96_9BRAD|nr:hypothetical protein [Bradyrhizobium jicamae]KRQ94721.1 hypothetical protein CQ12_04105 [Bradyrhizobium jicamae]